MDSIQDILVHMDPDKICKLRDLLEVAAHARARKIQILTAIDLVRQNVMEEINRLNRLNMCMDLTGPMVNSMVDHIYHLLTPNRREAFKTLANDANSVNQNAARASEDSINRMIRIDVEQATNSSFEDSLFGGTKEFRDKNDIEPF